MTPAATGVLFPLHLAGWQRPGRLLAEGVYSRQSACCRYFSGN